MVLRIRVHYPLSPQIITVLLADARIKSVDSGSEGTLIIMSDVATATDQTNLITLIRNRSVESI